MQRGPNGLYAWVIKADNTAEAAVEAATVEQTRIDHQGLNAGEKVVVNGQFNPAGRRVDAERRTAPRCRAVPRHEHLRTVHPPADRDLAADGRRFCWSASSPTRCCRWRRCRRSISRPSRSTAQLPGASPDTMASTVAHAARAAVRPDRRRHADDLDQRARQPRSPCSSTSTATSTPPRRTCRPRSTRPAASCRKNLPTPPTYRKVNPADSPILILGAHSDTLPLTEVDDYRRQRSWRSRSRRSPASRRSIIGGEQKPAVRVQVDPGEARRAGPDARGRARRRSPTPPPTPPRARIDGRGPSFTIYANDQLTKAEPYGTTSSSPTATARRCACATSAGRSTGRRTSSSRPGRTASAARPADRLQAAGRQRDRDGRPHQGALPRLDARRSRRR